MTSKPVDIPADLASAYLALLGEHETLQANTRSQLRKRPNAQAMLSNNEALIVALELKIEKLRRELRGQRSERTARLLGQMELQLEELVMAATEDEVAAQAAAAKTASVRSFTRKRPVRKPWPEDVERKRVVIDPPSTCACCGGSRLSKLGEDVTETLEEIPRRFIVIETVREKFSCRDCDRISQAPAPFHATPRGFIGPHLLATILFDKFGMHSPLNRQSTRFKCEGIELSTSTLGDQVGYGTAALLPIFDLIETHVFEAERLFGDDTTIPIQAKESARPDAYGLTYAMTGHSGERRRQPQSIMRPVTGAANIPRNTWPDTAAFCRAIAIMALSRSLLPKRKRYRSPSPFAMRMRDASSLNWPISRKMSATANARASQSRRSPWRPSNGTTRCLRSSARSMD
ncbi:transposase [Pseudorhizobium tarimense]|uniref:Transposase n=1 Tax=Pseudorhizobium tarimense TaxID=1079109 RepID=A0ABV2HEB1_9HYPH